MKTLLFLVLSLAVLTAPSQEAPSFIEPPLTTADLIPLSSDSLDPTLAASAPAVPVDPDLPQPFDPESLGSIVENSPFTRIVSISDSLVLTGMAYVDGKPVVTIFDKAQKQSMVVSDVTNLKGWKLIEAQHAEKIDRAQAKISIGGETFSIRHDAAALTPEAMRKDKSERGSPSGGGDRYKSSSRGPSEEDRKRYEALSEGAREKLKNVFREKFSDEKFRNAPEEERRNIMKGIVEKIEKEDQGRKR